METTKYETVLMSSPSADRIAATLSGLEGRLRLAATGREAYSSVGAVVHQLFDLTDARLGIVEDDGARAGCYELGSRGIASPQELVGLASTAYGQVVSSGCADYEPLCSSLVLPIQLDNGTSFLQLVKSGVDSFSYDEFELADRFVGVLNRELHSFKSRGGAAMPVVEERSPLGAKAPDTLSDLTWSTDAVSSQ